MIKNSRFLKPFGNNKFRTLLNNIKQRCTNPNHPRFKNYGGRGIGCLITLNELIRLWNRDKASEMIKPSIDRKDNNGHYTFQNCRFIELKKNVQKMHKEKFNDRTVLNCHIQIRKYHKRYRMHLQQNSKLKKVRMCKNTYQAKYQLILKLKLKILIIISD